MSDPAVVRARDERAQHDIAISQQNTLELILAELRHLRAALGQSAGVSSVEIKTSTRGVDVAAKAYAGSSIADVEGEAVDAYFRVLEQVQERLNNGVGPR